MWSKRVAKWLDEVFSEGANRWCQPPRPQACVEGGVGECALAGSRARSHRPASAHSQGRECALADAPLSTRVFAGAFGAYLHVEVKIHFSGVKKGIRM